MGMWEDYFMECEVISQNNAEMLRNKCEECVKYVESVIKKSIPDCGIVYTKLEESIQYHGRFYIWLPDGTHRAYKLEDCGMEPLVLEPYPVRPDRY